MAPYKAPGLDGFPTGFYQNSWKTVGPSIYQLVVDFFDQGTIPEGLNNTLLALIPKVAHPETVKQFRHISLCNVTYKIIAKVIVINRLKPIMEQLVSHEQSSFVPGRQISDNIIIYQEVLHSIRTRSSGKKIMVIKIDLEKAYDRLRWSFIQDTLLAAGFNQN